MGAGALLGGCALLLKRVSGVEGSLARQHGREGLELDAARLAEPAAILYSVCLQCHTGCSVKGRIYDDVLGKIDGSLYSPQTMFVHGEYGTGPDKLAHLDGKRCPKGQSGIQSLYDPYRLRTVLKRAGRRKKNKRRTIPFRQAIREIVERGRLFAEVPGEEQRHMPGLRELRALRDPAVAASLAADAEAVAAGQLSVDAFETRDRAHLSVLIDAENPDLGPKNNQFVFLARRIQEGRKDFSKRWLLDGFGPVNWREHTTICEQSHHIAYEQVTHQWRDGRWSGGRTHKKAHARSAEFVLYFGTSPFKANFGPPIMAEKITKGLVSGRSKIAVVDPRVTRTAANVWKWLPGVPGTDAAPAPTPWIIGRERSDVVRGLSGAASVVSVREQRVPRGVASGGSGIPVWDGGPLPAHGYAWAFDSGGERAAGSAHGPGGGAASLRVRHRGGRVVHVRGLPGSRPVHLGALGHAAYGAGLAEPGFQGAAAQGGADPRDGHRVR